MKTLFDFPSFSEGLSLRVVPRIEICALRGINFPSFSEGLSLREGIPGFPKSPVHDFPSFSEGLSLRVARVGVLLDSVDISLPFRRDFH